MTNVDPKTAVTLPVGTLVVLTYWRQNEGTRNRPGRVTETIAPPPPKPPAKLKKGAKAETQEDVPEVIPAIRVLMAPERGTLGYYLLRIDEAHRLVDDRGEVYELGIPEGAEIDTAQAVLAKAEADYQMDQPAANGERPKRKAKAQGERHTSWTPDASMPFRPGTAMGQMFDILRDGKPHTMAELYQFSTQIGKSKAMAGMLVKKLLLRSIITQTNDRIQLAGSKGKDQKETKPEPKTKAVKKGGKKK